MNPHRSTTVCENCCCAECMARKKREAMRTGEVMYGWKSGLAAAACAVAGIVGGYLIHSPSAPNGAQCLETVAVKHALDIARQRINDAERRFDIASKLEFSCEAGLSDCVSRREAPKSATPPRKPLDPNPMKWSPLDQRFGCERNYAGAQSYYVCGIASEPNAIHDSSRESCHHSMGGTTYVTDTIFVWHVPEHMACTIEIPQAVIDRLNSEAP